MKETFESGDRDLRDAVWRAVTQDVSESAERVLWQRDGSGKVPSSPESVDWHGLARHEVLAYSSVASLAWLVGAWCAFIAATTPSVVDRVIFALATLACVVGTVVAALWCYRAGKARRADSRRRRYLLTDERLIVVGADAFVEVPLSHISWARVKNRRDGTGTILCGYHDGICRKVIAIEVVEEATRIKELLDQRLAAISGRAIRECSARNVAAEEGL